MKKSILLPVGRNIRLNKELNIEDIDSILYSKPDKRYGYLYLVKLKNKAYKDSAWIQESDYKGNTRIINLINSFKKRDVKTVENNLFYNPVFDEIDEIFFKQEDNYFVKWKGMDYSEFSKEIQVSESSLEKYCKTLSLEYFDSKKQYNYDIQFDRIDKDADECGGRPNSIFVDIILQHFNKQEKCTFQCDSFIIPPEVFLHLGRIFIKHNIPGPFLVVTEPELYSSFYGALRNEDDIQALFYCGPDSNRNVIEKYCLFNEGKLKFHFLVVEYKDLHNITRIFDGVEFAFSAWIIREQIMDQIFSGESSKVVPKSHFQVILHITNVAELVNNISNLYLEDLYIKEITNAIDAYKNEEEGEEILKAPEIEKLDDNSFFLEPIDKFFEHEEDREVEEDFIHKIRYLYNKYNAIEFAYRQDDIIDDIEDNNEDAFLEDASSYDENDEDYRETVEISKQKEKINVKHNKNGRKSKPKTVKKEQIDADVDEAPISRDEPGHVVIRTDDTTENRSDLCEKTVNKELTDEKEVIPDDVLFSHKKSLFVDTSIKIAQKYAIVSIAQRYLSRLDECKNEGSIVQKDYALRKAATLMKMAIQHPYLVTNFIQEFPFEIMDSSLKLSIVVNIIEKYNDSKIILVVSKYSTHISLIKSVLLEKKIKIVEFNNKLSVGDISLVTYNDDVDFSKIPIKKLTIIFCDDYKSFPGTEKAFKIYLFSKPVDESMWSKYDDETVCKICFIQSCSLSTILNYNQVQVSDMPSSRSEPFYALTLCNDEDFWSCVNDVDLSQVQDRKIIREDLFEHELFFLVEMILHHGICSVDDIASHICIPKNNQNLLNYVKTIYIEALERYCRKLGHYSNVLMSFEGFSYAVLPDSVLRYIDNCYDSIIRNAEGICLLQYIDSRTLTQKIQNHDQKGLDRTVLCIIANAIAEFHSICSDYFYITEYSLINNFTNRYIKNGVVVSCKDNLFRMIYEFLDMETIVYLLYIPYDVKTRWTYENAKALLSFIIKRGIPFYEDGTINYDVLVTSLSLEANTHDIKTLLDSILNNNDCYSIASSYPTIVGQTYDKFRLLFDSFAYLNFIFNGKTKANALNMFKSAEKWDIIPDLSPELEYELFRQIFVRGFLFLNEILENDMFSSVTTSYKSEYLTNVLILVERLYRLNTYMPRADPLINDIQSSSNDSSASINKEGIDNAKSVDAEFTVEPQRKIRHQERSSLKFLLELLATGCNCKSEFAHYIQSIDLIDPCDALNCQIPVEDSFKKNDKIACDVSVKSTKDNVPSRRFASPKCVKTDDMEYGKKAKPKPRRVNDDSNRKSRVSRSATLSKTGNPFLAVQENFVVPEIGIGDTQEIKGEEEKQIVVQEVTEETVPEDPPSKDLYSDDEKDDDGDNESSDEDDEFVIRRTVTRKPKAKVLSSIDKYTDIIEKAKFLPNFEYNEVEAMDAQQELTLDMTLRGKGKLLSLGHIVPRNPNFYGERYVYPLGYKIIRRYRSTVSEDEESGYICEIKEHNNKPEFVVTCIDTGKVYSGASPTAPWIKIINDIHETSENQKRKSISGPELFLLNNKKIMELISKLPNFDKIPRSRKKKKTVDKSSTTSSSEIFEEDD